MQTQRKRILLADDNRYLRLLILNVLIEHYDVRAVADGNALEEELKNNEFDLIVSDLNLPHKMGSAVLRSMDHLVVGKSRIEGLGVPTIVITGMDSADEEVAMVRRMVSVRHILFKPLDINVLRRRVREVLEMPRLAGMSSDQTPAVGAPLPRVLVVDDDAEIRDMYSLVLEKEGMEVRCCASAAAAIRACKETAFDLIYLDYYLDTDTADQVLEDLKIALGPRMPPVLLVTSYADALNMTHYGRYPQVKAILAKPVSSALLIEMGKLVMAERAKAAARACACAS